VSALVHSSTLVTAGVYLLIRFNRILVFSGYSKFLFFLGVITITMAGIAALLETDIKKIIALSTLSQLGVIIIVLGAHKPLLAYFHLLSHAYFKALLFLCAGLIIHNIKDYQDIRRIGLGGTRIPFTIRVLSVSNISLCGLPFLSGFYSKDIILEIRILNRFRVILVILILLATFLTVLYSCRLLFFISSHIINSETMYSVGDGDNYTLVRII
jgi:NADH-ubiquinone oxidoreductase chain 5